MTVGYGDYSPIDYGRIVAVIEAFVGVGIFGMLVGILVVKLMMPRKNAIVFSKHCYFVEDEKRFVIIFLNTMDMPLINAEMCSLLKIGRGDWVVYPSFTSPYVGDSAWTFGISSLSHYDNNYTRDNNEYLERPVNLEGREIYPDDGIKFGITGSFGFSAYSTAIKYKFKNVRTIQSRNDLPKDILRKRCLLSPSFRSAFHGVPNNSQLFLDYAREKGANIMT